MKKICLTFIGIVVSLAAGAQVKVLDPASDTSTWYSSRLQICKKMQIPDLKASNDSLRCRLWIENQVIELWTNDFVHFQGDLYNYTERVATGKKTKKLPKFFSNKTAIDTSLARYIYTRFDAADLWSIPSDSQVPGWKKGKDGEELIFESAAGEHYVFKTYWTPAFQKNLPVAKNIEELSHSLKIKLDLSVAWISFINQLPPGCYHFGELGMSCREK